MLNVYRQAAPTRSVERDWKSGKEWEVWVANLQLVGQVETWGQAKALCVNPIVAEVKQQ